MDLKSYLVGKHGGVYTASLHLPSYLMGRAKSGGIQEITGTLPLAVRSRASQVLENYRIYGESVQDGTPTPDNPVEVTGLGVRTENLWNDDWFDKNISDNTAKYVHIYVGEGAFICSTTCPRIPNPVDGYASRFIFFLSGRVNTGAQNDVNGVWNGSPRTVTSSEGYVTLCYRKLETYDVRPWEYETMIVEGSTAPSSYIPYGYQLPLTVRTENLFDYKATSTGYISSSGSAGIASGNHKTDYLLVTPSETYTLDFDGRLNEAGNYLAWYDENKVVIAGSIVDLRLRSSHTRVAPVNAKYVRFSVRDSILSVTMFTKSSTAPDHYIPYYNTETPIYIGDSQLIEGEYVDYKEQKIYKLVDGVLTPTDPPELFPDITLPRATVTIDIEGELKPQATVKGLISPTN